MKNVVRIVALSALLVLAVALLASCGCKHMEVVDVAVAPTCTETGLTEGKHCSECGKVLVAQAVVPATGHTKVHMYAVEATCLVSGKTESEYCSTCKEVFIEEQTVAALGHTTTAGKCERCGQDIGDWMIGHYVDDFGQPTNDGYVINKQYIQGKFSNSATTNSKLNVEILVDYQDDIAIFLYEYARNNSVKNSSSRYSDEYDITIRTEDGTDVSVTGTIWPGGDRLFIDTEYAPKVLSLLKWRSAQHAYRGKRQPYDCVYFQF